MKKIFYLYIISILILCLSLMSCRFDPSGVPCQHSIVQCDPPYGCIGDAYRFTFEAGCPHIDHSWSIYSGSLPDGLVLDTNTGTISGTPTQNGGSTFFIEIIYFFMQVN